VREEEEGQKIMISEEGLKRWSTMRMADETREKEKETVK